MSGRQALLAPDPHSPTGVCASTSSQLRLCKLLYFLNGFSGSSFGRFATIFYIQVAHLTASQIGYVEAAQPIAGAIGSSILGWMTDRLQRKKAVSLLCRCTTTAVLMLLLLPSVKSHMLSILVTMAGVAFFGVGGGVLDSSTLDLLGDARRGDYGKYRLWLALSWGVGNAAMGNIARLNFDYNFYAMAGLNSLAILLMALFLPSRTQAELKRMKELGQRRESSTSSVVAAGTAASELGSAPPQPGQPSGGTLDTSSSFSSAFCRWRMVAFLLELSALGVGFALVEKFLFVCVFPPARLLLGPLRSLQLARPCTQPPAPTAPSAHVASALRSWCALLVHVMWLSQTRWTSFALTPPSAVTAWP